MAIRLGLVDRIDVSQMKNYYHRSLLRQRGIEEQERVHKLLYFFAKFPGQSPLWHWMVKRASYSLLYLFFLVGLTFSYRANMAILWRKMVHYGLLNFRVISPMVLGLLFTKNDSFCPKRKNGSKSIEG